MITEEEFAKVYALLQESPNPSESRYIYLQNRIKVLDPSLAITFIPRTLYELIFLRKCVQEDLKRQELSCANFVGIKPGGDPEAKIERMTGRKPFWQICIFDDKHPGNSQSPHIRKIAYKLNQAILKRFKAGSCSEGFSYAQISKVSEQLISYLKSVNEKSSSLVILLFQIMIPSTN